MYFYSLLLYYCNYTPMLYMKINFRMLKAQDTTVAGLIISLLLLLQKDSLRDKCIKLGQWKNYGSFVQ
jgi:hypothetical protein